MLLQLGFGRSMQKGKYDTRVNIEFTDSLLVLCEGAARAVVFYNWPS